MTENKRQGSVEYLGVRLPEGMTVACAKELATLLNMHELSDESNCSAAVRVFEIVLRNLK